MNLKKRLLKHLLVTLTSCYSHFSILEVFCSGALYAAAMQRPRVKKHPNIATEKIQHLF